MNGSLIDAFSKLVTPNLLGNLSSALGESEAATSKTLAAAAPAVLAGMLGKASDHGAMGMLEGLLRDKSNDGSVLGNLSSLVGAGASDSPMGMLGGKLLSGVFGNQLGPIAGALAGLGGVKSATASSLLGMVAPMLMSVLSSRMRESGTSLAGLLNSQRDSITNAVPSGLSTVLGAMNMPKMPKMPEMPRVSAPALPEKSGFGWLLPLAAVAVLAFLGWNLLGRGTPKPTPMASAPVAPAAVEPAAVAPAPTPAPLPSTPWPDLGAFARRMLPNSGGELNIPARGIESKLLAFIESPAAVDSTTWFDFDRILFDTGAATLRAESDEQIANIGAILKAFPAVALKVGGYTDNTGNADANLRLSQARADTVMKAITATGVAGVRLAAEGYGDQHPVADNATDEGRQKNRRVSVRVTKK